MPLAMWSKARKIVLAAVAILALLALAAPAGAVKNRPTARSIASADALESQVLAEVNRVRSRHGLRPLRLSTPLSTAAAGHSRQMAARGYFGHNSLDGSSFWKRVRRHYRPSGYSFWSVGENLLWASPDIGAAGTVTRWMRSPAHRANLLTPRWREIGLAAVRAADAPGVYGGLDVTIVTAEFGIRR